eukprot:111777-Chlamydomonas_euryale.AAC.1
MCDYLKRQASQSGAPPRQSRPGSASSQRSKGAKPQPHVNQMLANVVNASQGDLCAALASREAAAAKRAGPTRMQE